MVDAETERAPERQLQHLLFALESLLQLLASSVVVDAFEAREHQPVIDALKGLRRDGHASLGLWHYVLLSLTPALPRPLITELPEVVASPEFGERLGRLCAKRNQLAHPTPLIDRSAAAKHIAELRRDFEPLLESLDFLGGYHLLGVCDDLSLAEEGQQRFSAISLRGRTVPQPDVSLTVTGGVQTRDVLLVNPEVGVARLLYPFFLLSGPGNAPDLLTFTRSCDDGLHYYTTSRPDSIVVEPMPTDSKRRACSIWAWLATSRRRRSSIEFSVDDAKVGLGETRRLRLRGWGAPALPLRELRHFRTGGTAEVFLGRDPTSNAPRVLKVPRDPFDQHAKNHFEKEYAILSGLRHEGIIAVYECRRVENVGPCIVEEFFDSPTLYEHLESGPFAPDEARGILELLLDAVGVLHERGIVHRDLKPANVLYRRDEPALKVIDLGIARQLDGPRNETTLFGAGTPGFMAPEQVRGGEITPATDVFALAYVARALYCGVDAMKGDPEGFADSRIPKPIRVVLEKAARESPSERYANAREMLVAFREASIQVDVTGAEPSTQTPTDMSRLTEAEAAFEEDVDRIFGNARSQITSLRSELRFATSTGEFTVRLLVVRESFSDELEKATDRFQRMLNETVMDRHHEASSRLAASSIKPHLAGIVGAGQGAASIGAFAGLGATAGLTWLAPLSIVAYAYEHTVGRKGTMKQQCDDLLKALDASRSHVINASKHVVALTREASLRAREGRA